MESSFKLFHVEDVICELYETVLVKTDSVQSSVFFQY